MVEGGLECFFLIVLVGQRTDFTPEGYKKVYDEAIAKLTPSIASPGRSRRTRSVSRSPDDARRIAASARKGA